MYISEWTVYIDNSYIPGGEVDGLYFTYSVNGCGFHCFVVIVVADPYGHSSPKIHSFSSARSKFRAMEAHNGVVGGGISPPCLLYRQDWCFGAIGDVPDRLEFIVNWLGIQW